MRVSSIVALLGFVIVSAGTYCPLLRPFGLFSWNIYDLNKPYGVVILIVALVGIAALLLQQSRVAKMAAYISLALVTLLLLAAIMKVNTTFSFIPFKGLAAGLSHLIKFTWGWYILFAGSVLAVWGTINSKQIVTVQNQK
jgi:hypothetical protein